nr:MAG TPA: hypothetical protein [Caudoviricetes sp.]
MNGVTNRYSIHRWPRQYRPHISGTKTVLEILI